MRYTTFVALNAVLPGQFATEALDDDNDGIVDAWDAVLADAENQVNAALEGRYPLPLPDPLPLTVQEAAVVFVAAACYTRRDRDVPADLVLRIKAARTSLREMRKGTDQLTPNSKSATPRGTVISAKSRVSSRLGTCS